MTLPTVYSISSLPQRNVASSAGRKCYCYPNAICAPVRLEKPGVTECIVSSLNFTNSDAILSLTENYLSEKNLAFSSVTLKALVSFMINDAFLQPQKQRIISILDAQLRLHPGCAAYMADTYKALLLVAEDDYLGLKSLDYVLGQFEQAVSKREDSAAAGCFSAHRISRRVRKQKVLFDELDSKKSKLNGDSDEAMPESTTPGEPITNSKPMKVDNLAVVLNFLTDILRHDLGSVMSRGANIQTAIVCKLMFQSKNASCLNIARLSKVFVTCKNCVGVPERRSLLKLIELVAEVCLLVDGEDSVDLRRSGRQFTEFVNEFVRLVLTDQSPARVVELIVDLKPEWLRYRAAHAAYEKVTEKRVSAGLKGLARSLKLVLTAAQKVEGEWKTLNVLHDVDWNKQLQDAETVAGITEMYRDDDIGAVTRLSKAGIDFSQTDKKGRSALHSVAQFGSVKCAEYILNHSKKRLNVHAEDYMRKTPLMYATENNHAEVRQLLLDYAVREERVENKPRDNRVLKKLTPPVCKLMMILVDSNVKLMKFASDEDRALNIEYYGQLRETSRDLLRLKNVPDEVRVFALILDHIKF